MSHLEEHLHAWNLDAVRAVLLDAGIELVQDALELTCDDLQGLGLSTAQAIALRHSFGLGGEHAAAVAAAMASVAGSEVGMQLSTAESATQDVGGWGREVASQLECHMSAHGLSDAITLLREGGLELLADVRALDWVGMHAMGLSAKHASTLRDSLGMDATLPGELWPVNELSAEEAPTNESRPPRITIRAGSMIEEINAMKKEDRINKSRPPRRSRDMSPHRVTGSR